MNIVFTIKKRAAVAVVPLLVAGLASGCGSSAAAPGSVSVVASTTVWADVARDVAGALLGSKVSVTAIIDDPAADPHSYEVSTRDELAIRRAAIIVANGGGYDDFVGQMRSASGAHGTVLDAVRISGRSESGDVNEHVWYDFPTVSLVARAIASELARRDPAHAAAYRANVRSLDARLAGLERREAALAARFRGTPVAITEPLPLYMLAACGLVNRTPPEFSAAIEGEQEVAVRLMRRMHDLLSGHHVRVLVPNAQTTGPQTSELIDAARKAGVPVVPMTETLPRGSTYLDWMSQNLARLARALGSTA